MAKRTQNILKIIEAGSNVIVSSVKGKSKDLLIQIAQAAVENDVHVTFMKCENWNTTTLIDVAETGEDHVTFEV